MSECSEFPRGAHDDVLNALAAQLRGLDRECAPTATQWNNFSSALLGRTTSYLWAPTVRQRRGM